MAKRMRRRRGALAQERSRRRRGWVVAAISAAAFVFATVAVGRGNGPKNHHPTPRPASEQPNVVRAGRYAQYPRVAETYKMANAVKAKLDGVYWYCNCAEHSGHYSLLDCFTSDHAARCDVCMSEGVITYQMTQNGASLDDIRAEIDNTYGT